MCNIRNLWIGFAVAIAFGLASPGANAETWKSVGNRKSDGAAVYVDVDYLVESGSRIEVRTKVVEPKNPLLLLLPAKEVEEKYAIDCEDRKYGVVYRKVIGPLTTTIELDALPASVTFRAVDAGMILSSVVDWSCTEQKTKMAARASPSASATPRQDNSKQKPRSDIDANWNFVGASTNDAESYWIDVDSIVTERRLTSFWVRENLKKARTIDRSTYLWSAAQYSTDCVNQKLTEGTFIYYDAGGRAVSPQSGTKPTEVINATSGTIAKAIYDSACSAAKGGDYDQSRVFPKGIDDPSVDLQVVPNTAIDEYKVFIDKKAASRESAGRIASAKIILLRVAKQDMASPEKLKLAFSLVLFDCKDRTYAYSSEEAFDGFGQMYTSSHKTQDQLVERPILARSLMESVAEMVCKLPPESAAANKTPSGTNKPDSLGSGTGWYLDVGYVVTAFHVVEGKKRIVLYGPDKKPVSARIVAADIANDIVILDADFQPRPTVGLPIAKVPPSLGARVFTIGFPHPDLLGLSPKYTAGEVSAISGIGDDPRTLQISVPVQSGNSGGPLINTSGEVVGIVTAKLSADKILKATGDLTQNINYAIKARYLQGMIDDLGNRPAKAARPKAGSADEIISQAKGAIFLVIAE